MIFEYKNYNEKRDSMDKNVGQYLKELREKKHLSQNQLAEKLHISRSVIAKYETGEREPSFNNLVLISKYFKIPITNLIPIYENSIESTNTKDILNYLLKQNKFFKTIVFALIIIIFTIIVSAIIYINVLNYVSTKIYRVTSIDKNPIIKDGLLIKTKDKVYLSLISNLDPDKVEKVEFFYQDGEEKVFMFGTSNSDYIKFYSDLKTDEYISFKNYDNFFNGSLIKVYYKDDTTECINLIYKFDYTNNNLEEKYEEIEESSESTDSVVAAQAFFETPKSGLYDIVAPFIEDHKNEIFEIKLDGIKYEVNITDNFLSIFYKNNNKRYNLLYTLNKETLMLDELNSSSKILYNMNFKTDKCDGKMCSNVDEDIELIKEIIKEIKK